MKSYYFHYSTFILFFFIVGCSDNSKPNENENENDIENLPANQIRHIYTIMPDKQTSEISPYIYGLNVEPGFSHTTNDPSTTVRFGGNRLTGYNWENNASNAGADWYHYNDNYLQGIIDNSNGNIPGSIMSTFVSNALQNNKKPLITVPMSYAVAADKNGQVVKDDPNRWKILKATKNTLLSLEPDIDDKYVYTDEYVNFLVQKFGKGKMMYSLDNEPDLWSHTHPYICPTKITCSEFLDRTIEFAQAVKSIDQQAETFGFVSFGFTGFLSFSDASDWTQIKKTSGYSWFIDYFLDKTAQASQIKGKRLIDVLDIHWYPEVKGDNRIVGANANTQKDKDARLQAPRTLWDKNYKEDSWIGQWNSDFLPLIPKIQASIDKYNPGTKLAFTEFQYGGYQDITGTISLVDALGIFGKYGVYASYHWGNPGKYGILAYHLYCNYDGKSSKFGNISVENKIIDWKNSSLYTAVHKNNPKKLNIIVTNKYLDKSISGKFILDSKKKYENATIYLVSESLSEIQYKGSILIHNNEFIYTLPPLSVAHIIAENN